MRSCFRCGEEFEQIRGRERICQACRQPHVRPPNPALTFRENQVTALVAKALTNKAIAHELHLTEGTIKEYLNRIFRKVSVDNRTSLAIWYINKPQ